MSISSPSPTIPACSSREPSPPGRAHRISICRLQAPWARHMPARIVLGVAHVGLPEPLRGDTYQPRVQAGSSFSLTGSTSRFRTLALAEATCSGESLRPSRTRSRSRDFQACRGTRKGRVRCPPPGGWRKAASPRARSAPARGSPRGSATGSPESSRRVRPGFPRFGRLFRRNRQPVQEGYVPGSDAQGIEAVRRHRAADAADAGHEAVLVAAGNQFRA